MAGEIRVQVIANDFTGDGVGDGFDEEWSRGLDVCPTVSIRSRK